MTINTLIAKLKEMKDSHGGECRVLSGHEEIETVGHVPPSGGCAEYISIEE